MSNDVGVCRSVKKSGRRPQGLSFPLSRIGDESNSLKLAGMEVFAWNVDIVAGEARC